MRQTKFVSTTNVSAENVLEIIRDQYRHAERLDPESERGIELTFESSIADWREACNLLPFAKLWPALNAWFGVTFRASQWLEVLEPAQHKTLSGVCALIATEATRPTICPFLVAGIECWSAGTFLTIRSLLAQAGVPVRNVRPSSLLAKYTREYGAVFITEMGRLAPGTLPVPTIKETAAYKLSIAAFCIGFAILLLGFKWHDLYTAASVLLVIGFGGAGISSRYPPRAFTFGNLITFRDRTEAVLQSNRADPT